MIKAMIVSGSKRALMLGLSFGNLDILRQQPLDTFITVDGAPIGINCDIILFSGETEADMERLLKHDLGGNRRQ